MGHTPRFDIFLEKHIGIGIRWDTTYPYALNISLALIFFTITVGMGEDEQDMIPINKKEVNI